MKFTILFLCVMGFASCEMSGQIINHKSEAEIAAMTPAQRIDEYAAEQVNHKFDELDEQSSLLAKYIRIDGLKAMPRIIELMNGYDPIRFPNGKKGELFDAAWMLFGELDSHVIRLRGTEDGLRAIEALERAINRMRAAGYGKRDQHEWEQHGRFEEALTYLDGAKLINSTDHAIRDTIWVKNKIEISDQELLRLSNFLIARDATYPSWSTTTLIKDTSRINEAGNPLQVFIMKEPDRFYTAYLEFKKTKR